MSCLNRASTCILTFEDIKQNNTTRILIDTTGSEKEIQDKTYATNDIGGYYSFNKNGLIKSYYFFANTDSTYDKTDPENILLEEDTTTNRVSFCSYAEEYDSTGRLKKVLGNPLVFKDIVLNKDTLSVSLYFFSLNKIYDSVNIQTNSNDLFRLKLTDDSLYTNMKKTSFSYDFKGRNDIQMFIETNFLNSCSNRKENLRDTISLKHSPTSKQQNGM